MSVNNGAFHFSIKHDILGRRLALTCSRREDGLSCRHGVKPPLTHSLLLSLGLSMNTGWELGRGERAGEKDLVDTGGNLTGGEEAGGGGGGEVRWESAGGGGEPPRPVCRYVN